MSRLTLKRREDREAPPVFEFNRQEGQLLRAT